MELTRKHHGPPEYREAMPPNDRVDGARRSALAAGRGSKAFTLLEVLLSIVLVLGLMGALMTLYLYALDVRKAVVQQMQIYGAQRIIMERMTNEFRSAMALPAVGVGLQGQTDNVKFISTRVPGAPAWAVRTSPDDFIPVEQDLQLVAYQLQTEADGVVSPSVLAPPSLSAAGPSQTSGGSLDNLTVDGLLRSSQKVIAAQAADPNMVIQTSLLAAQMKFLGFRYWDGAAWQSSWTSNDLPAAVEITLGLDPLPDGMTADDYVSSGLHQIFQRVVYLPGSKAAAGSVTNQGLPGSGGGP